ncbi:MAG: hypothetical protein EXR73_02625 [Myxococcales bacterium]|nr:hypothetical protein [Myxococcales bacterium]
MSRLLVEPMPGILTWPRFSERFGYDFHGTLVRHEDGNLCIDPVDVGDGVLEALLHEGVRRILLTNRNHYRDAARVREATGARVLVHPADAEFVRQKSVPVDGQLLPGQLIGPFTVLGVPGKSPGEIALHDAARRLLLIGDACVGNPPGQLALLPAQAIDDLPLLRQSLRALHAAVDFDTLLLGDGAAILSGARDQLGALVATFPVD